MTLEECYNKLHGDYQEAQGRLMSDKLINRFILRFPSDPSMDALREMIAAKENASAFRAVHTLKGVAANLAFTELFKNASNLTEQMRDLVSEADPVLYANVEESYKLVIDTLKEYEESQK